MDILTILEHTLQDGMSIEVIKEYRNKYKIRLYYNGEVADNIIIYKNFEAGREKARCRYAIDAAMALFYARKENYPEAKAWLSGERWGDSAAVDFAMHRGPKIFQNAKKSLYDWLGKPVKTDAADKKNIDDVEHNM